MRVLQLVHTLNYGDAISGEALAIQALLTQDGIANEILSVHAHEKVGHYRKPLSEAGELSSADATTVLLLHFSIQSPINELFLRATNCTRVLVYHNLTPASWFAGCNRRVYDDLVAARSSLEQVVAASDILIADSSFNKDELVAVTDKPVMVLPLLLDHEKWSVPANPGIRAALKGHGGVNLLAVGRIAPNKCLEDAIKAFYFYHHKINRKSKLWLIGSDIDTEIYSFELRELARELRLHEAVEFVGSVSDGELKAFYEEAAVYLCMSEHEGFCVPLLEAMHFGVPVIAYNAGAVAETLGDGGVLVGEKDPARLSELIEICISNSEFKHTLREAGRSRIAQFTQAIFHKQLRTVLQVIKDSHGRVPLNAEKRSRA